MLKEPEAWAEVMVVLQESPAIKSVVLFGSRARSPQADGSADGWSDTDLHVISSRPQLFEDVSWLRALRKCEPCLHVVRPASGGVRKVTLLYADGEVDIVVIPQWQMRVARLGLKLGLPRKSGSLRQALNEMSTIMRGGYRFLKGEQSWGGFYAQVTREMPGQRLEAGELITMADQFLCDYLWVKQKIARGELIAAQRALHRLLAETNFRMLHEWRLRQSESSFREARRLEMLLSPEELMAMQCSARLDPVELSAAADHAGETMRLFAQRLIPEWREPPGYASLLAKAISAR